MPNNKDKNQPNVPQLLEALASPDPNKRSKAADELGSFRVWEGLLPLLPLLSDSYDQVRAEATSAVAFIADRLWEIPSDYHPDRKEFLENAKKTIREIVIPKFIELLSDPFAEVRLNAIYGLQDLIRNSIVIAPLLARLYDVDSRVRIAAINSLNLIHSPRITQAFLSLLHDPDLDIRIATIETLGRKDYGEAVPYLLQLLTDENSKVRETTIRTLTKLESMEMVPNILQLLSDTDNNVRLAAIEAVEDLGVVQAVPQLIELLFDANVDIRRAVVSALGTVEDKEALAGLINATNDKNLLVRLAAITSIGQIGGLENLNLLAKLEQSEVNQEEDYLIIDAATRAIKNIKKSHL